MRNKKILKKNPNVVTRRIEKETILVPVLKTSDDMDCIYTLNKPASAVWDMIDGKKTFGQIKKEVLNKFNTDEEEAEKKLAELIKDLKQIKAIR